jgi:DNA-binding MarR family transcriptional regulator
MTLYAPSPGSEEFDPALLAFVKCHVTSPPKWEALRVLATEEGRWLTALELARATHKDVQAVTAAISELSREGVIEERPGPTYRLPPREPTTVVLRRLIATTTHSQELRALIANHLLRNRQAA